MNSTIRLTDDQEREVAEGYAQRHGLVIVAKTTFAGMQAAIRAEPAKVPQCEGAADCGWEGIVIVKPTDSPESSGWRACREHAAPFRRLPARFTVIDVGRQNRHAS